MKPRNLYGNNISIELMADLKANDAIEYNFFTIKLQVPAFIEFGYPKTFRPIQYSWSPI
jgi:hypothetical protein